MKALIVGTNREKSPQTLIPLGACCVASAAQSAGHDVSVLDLCFSRTPTTDVESAVKRFQPDVITYDILVRRLSSGISYAVTMNI